MESDDSDVELDRKVRASRPSIRAKSRYSKLDSDDSDCELPLKHTAGSRTWSTRFTSHLSSDDSDNELYTPRKVKPNPPASNISSDLLQDIMDKKEILSPSKAFEESIRGCYSKPKRTVERSCSAMDTSDMQVTVRPRAYKVSRLLANYRDIEDDSVEDRPRRRISSPARSSSVYSSPRYSKPVEKAEDSDEDVDVMIGRITSTPNRRYYSRSTIGDPDYYDYDLQHAVDMYRTHKSYTPKFSPQTWEHKLLSEVNVSLGNQNVSARMFNKDQPDWRYQNSGFLSSALRTETFWANRFEKLYEGLREKP